MEQESVNFKQERDFGEIFNVTFSFIKQEFKPLGKAVLYYALPLLMLAAILGLLVSIQQQKYLNGMRAADLSDTANLLSQSMGTYKYTFLSLLVYVIGLSALRCTILGYIKLYVARGKDQFTMEEVGSEVKANLIPILGISILISVIITVGFVLCLVPGIILGVSLSLIYAAYFFENQGFSNAFSRSFQLTGPKWWLTLGIILIAYILVYLMMMILSVPAILMGLRTVFGNIKSLQTGEAIQFSTAFYIVNSITSLITYILVSIPFIILSFHYYSLVERKEKLSLKDKIAQIG